MGLLSVENPTLVYRGVRTHKFNFRLKRFRNDDTLLFHEGLSERELAELNSIPRVWDSGKKRWVLSLSLK